MKFTQLGIIAFSIGLLSLNATAANERRSLGKSDYNNRQRGADSPPEVVSPPSGSSEGAMSTVDPNRALKAVDESRSRKAMRKAAATPYHEWLADDELTVEQSAPVTAGNPALKRLYLEKLVNKLHHMHQMDIALAKMGESKAKSTEVLNLSHQIRADHERFDKELMKMANRRDINVESFQLATHEKAVSDHLKGIKNAGQFEMAYLDVLKRGHWEAKLDFEDARDETSDTEIAEMIDRSLPAIAQHQPSNTLMNRSRAGTVEEGLGD